MSKGKSSGRRAKPQAAPRGRIHRVTFDLWLYEEAGKPDERVTLTIDEDRLQGTIARMLRRHDRRTMLAGGGIVLEARQEQSPPAPPAKKGKGAAKREPKPAKWRPGVRKPCPACGKEVSNLKLHQGMDKNCPANAAQSAPADRM